jgi:predicted amino acid-binding ACT domain protein
MKKALVIFGMMALVATQPSFADIEQVGQAIKNEAQKVEKTVENFVN